MKYPRKDTPENIAKARELRAGGMCWAHIAREIGVYSGYSVKRWLDPKTAERNRESQRNSYQPHPLPPHFFKREERATSEEVSARLREIPPDTRTTTGVICGDPLPGRDALSRRAP